jgi:hypothetical protein
MISKQGRRFGRPNLSTLIALFALFAALGGSAYAANKINGKNIKKNTVTSKALKDGTIKTKDMSSKAINSLKGQKGDQGAQGPQGPQGAPGVNGVIDPISLSENTGINLTDGNTLAVATANVSAGTQYVVNAKIQAFGGVGVTQLDCSLSRGGTEIDRAQWNPPANNTRTTMAFQGVTGTTGTTITIGCTSSDGTSSASFRRITAIPVG